MRFHSLTVENFRAVRRFAVQDLTDFILIAGPNGCGKSCILDAIRLLKSVYGGYQENEWLQWFGEFQINMNSPADLRRMFRNPEEPVVIRAQVQLSQSEKDYLQRSAESVLEPLVWRDVTGQALDSFNFSTTAIAAQFRQHGDTVRGQVAQRADALRSSLSADYYDLALTITPKLQLTVTPNSTLEAVFRTYEPRHLGIIDYHSASRTYSRESIGGINLDVQNVEAQRRQQSLYNWQAKYQNVKSELATTYLRELVAREAGQSVNAGDLNKTLTELFQTFFPDKAYLGVTPDPTGGLTFPVRLSSGEVHDINELSSGEKEVLYGYLRLRNSTPQHSSILLDEPELHLNPALLRGFPDFYHKHIGRAKGNQLWLVTHSDTLLRQAVGNSNYSVYHMTTASSAASGDPNQALEVIANDELEAATIDLVGDLATYRPHAKVVILEGGGDTEFDVSAVERLFPEFAKRVNLVSGGNKQRVRDLYEILDSMAAQVQLGRRFFAIVDKDTEPRKVPGRNARSLTWDVYHIENYLLEPKYIRAAAIALTGTDRFGGEEVVKQALRESAQDIISTLVLERLQKHVNDQLVSALDIGARPDSPKPAAALLPSINGSLDRVRDLGNDFADESQLQALADQFEATLRSSLDGETWMREFPGREILRRFVGRRLSGIANYDAFRNVVVAQMVDGGYEPEGMGKVIDAILATDD